MKIIKILVSLLVLITVSCKEESKKEVKKEDPGIKAEVVAPAGGGGFVEVQKPHESSSFQIDEGANVYKVTCAICHGPKGLGDGVAGRSLKPKPRDLVAGKWTVGGDSISLFKTVTDGIKGTSMAGFKQLPIEKRWAVVHYIRSITKNKSKDNLKKLEEFASTAK